MTKTKQLAKETMIEVEIKVHVNDEQTAALIAGAQFISQKELITEIYDSADYRLTTKGFWLRRRNGIFELKYPATKDDSFHFGKNNPMHEITDEHEIRQIIGLRMNCPFEDALADAGYTVLYRFTNARKTYKKDGFTIDFDRADFGDLVYCVCEVEKLVDSADQTEQVLESLYAFVKQHGISTERAEGKLEYYMRIKHPAHYNEIANSFKNQ